jgi:ferritin-like protein
MSNRRTIRETVEVGINNVAELQGSLLTAIQLEFSTIPLYLCAEWSIDSDPSGDVSDMIHGVVLQEMLHFGLACNMYTATGGSLTGEIATPGFVPVYPADGLPGGVHPGLHVSLLPVGRQALQTFMSIEYPEMTPVVQQPDTPPPPAPPPPPTIGKFYKAITAAFNTVFPDGSLPHSPSANQVVARVGARDRLFAINTPADALKAIAEITDQGEGTSTSPDRGVSDPDTHAHYYTFAEIYYGKTIAQVGNDFQYSGSDIIMPTVHDFVPQSPGAPGQQTFIHNFVTLMTQLEQCWTRGFRIGTAISTMGDLQQAGIDLIQAGFTPQFTFA